MFQKIILSVFIIFMLQSGLSADSLIKSDTCLTLEMCMDIGRTMNPQIIKAKEEVLASKSKTGQSRADFFPQLSFSSGYSRSGTDSWGDSPDRYSGSLGLSQNIYDFGKTSTRVRIAELNTDSSLWSLDEIVNSVIFSIKKFYYQVLYAQGVEEVAVESLEQCNKHLEAAIGFYETGKSPKFDVTTAEVDCANAQLDLIKAKNNTLLALVSLNNAMGISDAPAYTVEDVFAKRYPEIRFETVLESAYSNRPDVKIADIQKKSAEYSVSLARKGYYPSLSGNAGYNWSGSAIDSGDSSWNVGLALNIPLFDGFSTKYGIEESLANFRTAVNTEDNLKQSVFLEVKQAYLNFMESVESMPAAELVVRQAKENLELANGRYETGVGSPLEVTDARLSYSKAQNSYIAAVYEYHNNKAILDKSMGVQ